MFISGGQTGVDRGVLDACIASDFPYGGYCPKGRLAEDGRIADRYNLIETESEEYTVRTRRNVVESDATVVVFDGLCRSALHRPSGIIHMCILANKSIVLLHLLKDKRVTTRVTIRFS